MANQRIQVKRGLDANLPTSGLLVGEPLITKDRGNLAVATDATTTINITPAIDKLTTLASVTGAADLLIIHDADATGQKEKKITVDALKAAFNIPAGSSDEKVAVVSGGTSGYLWGTDGSDGVIKMGSSMQWTKDVADGYVTLDVSIIDGGTF